MNNPEFGRVKVSNGKRERLASIDFRRVQAGWFWGNGLTPDDSPLLLKDEGTEDVYSLEWELP